jgi:hypothetical protein
VEAAVKAERDRKNDPLFVPIPLRSVFIEGLPMNVFDLVECQAIEFTLMNVFSEHEPEDIAVVPGQGYAFMRVGYVTLRCIAIVMRLCCALLFLFERFTPSMSFTPCALFKTLFLCVSHLPCLMAPLHTVQGGRHRGSGDRGVRRGGNRGHQLRGRRGGRALRTQAVPCR